MSELEFHHIGYACESVDRQRKHFAELGYVDEGLMFEDRAQKVRGCFMVLGPNRIELLEPTKEDSPLWPYLRKGINMYHLAYLSRHFEATIADMVKSGAGLTVSKPMPATAFQGRKICFLMLRNRLLIEIIEAANL